MGPSPIANAQRRSARGQADCNWWVTFGFGGVAVTCQSQQCQSHVDGIEKSNGRTNFSYLSLQLTYTLVSYRTAYAPSGLCVTLELTRHSTLDSIYAHATVHSRHDRQRTDVDSESRDRLGLSVILPLALLHPASHSYLALLSRQVSRPPHHHAADSDCSLNAYCPLSFAGYPYGRACRRRTRSWVARSLRPAYLSDHRSTRASRDSVATA